MKEEDRNVYERLKSNETLKRQQEILGSVFRHPVWYISEAVPTREEIRKHVLSGCRLARSRTQKALNCIFSHCGGARRTRVAQVFTYGPDSYGAALPMMQGDKIYGYILLCNAEKSIPDVYIQMFKSSLDNIIREAQKELELTKLYETIRPRAIALSTVHTIHRLLSSTLDLEELLPRIARLSMQVMRASRCSIKLLDQTKKVLLPNTTIDLRKNKKIRLMRLPLGKGIPGKAAKRGKVMRGKSYLSVPLIDEDVIGVITVYDKIVGRAFNQFDEEILTTLAEQAVIAIKNAQLYREQQEIILGSIKSLAIISSTRTPHMYRPSKFRVKLTLEVGREMGMKMEGLRSLEVATILHDAGQVSVPDGILTKKRKLTGREYEIIKEHPSKGVEIIEPLKALRPAIPMILHHHEKYDGSGYPAGLKGDDIPLGARIMAVTGAFEAMVLSRPYRRRTKSIEEAVEEITRYSNTQFDPNVINAFVKVIHTPDIKNFINSQMDGRGARHDKWRFS